MTLYFPWQIFEKKNTQIPYFIKIHSMGEDMFHADGWKEKQKCRSWQSLFAIWESAWNPEFLPHSRTTSPLQRPKGSSIEVCSENHKAPYTLSVKLNDFTVWRHTWRKNWVNCAVLTGNSAGLRTVLSSRLSHTELHSSLKESHSFLSLHADTTMA
jgi:hypothetical protein